ncbi:hypothetical protein K438DRAFT_1755126 [Mycena galopus ATCC 62051]|nr:hypothetical protein K438DRAFT_1755126 [Mycena galopus ATCC 62051]
MSESSALTHRRSSGALSVVSSESLSESSSSASSPEDQFQREESDSEPEETENRSGMVDSCKLEEVVVWKMPSSSVTEKSPSMPMKRQSGPRISLHWESLVEALSSDELLELSLEVSESEFSHQSLGPYFLFAETTPETTPERKRLQKRCQKRPQKRPKIVTLTDPIRDEQILDGCQVLGPFADEEEWELAKWLIKNVDHNQADVFLKLPIIGDRVKPSFDNKRTLLNAIDRLPIGADWKVKHIPVTGDITDESGQVMTETAELWFRDPVECVKELIGNPSFKDVKRQFVDAEGAEQLINEMSSASWWWKMQMRLLIGSTCVPIILSSDKTRLSQQRGDKTAWPVYLTIGNIWKDTRRKASSHATILLGYLPTPKFDCFTDATRSVAKYRLFHYCMGLIMESLADAGTNGNRCPECKVLPKERGDHCPHEKRDMDETLDYINRYSAERKDPQFKQQFKKTLGLRPVAPFWAGLPHTDIFEAFTPDILHQLHKGVFKDHLVSWCTAVVGEKEMDARFKSMPSHPDVQHFKHGISTVSQWTGGEHKKMEKIFPGLMAGHAEPAVIKTATAVVDFIHLSSFECHTTTSLAVMDTALDVFHENNNIFLELEARGQGHFNIPKIHSMEHYTPGIRLFGSAAGFNTEAPERLHIDYAKEGYRASNKKDYISQMTTWLQRQEAVDRFTAYLVWCKGTLKLTPRSTITPLTPLPTSDEPAAISRIVAAPPANDILVPAPAPLPLITYKIAKSHPAGLRNIDVASISGPAINAQQFLPAVQTYIRKHSSSFVPQSFDRFALFKHITITLPSIAQVSDLKPRNVVRASPPVAAVPGTRNHGERAYQDFALIRTGERNAATDGTALEGLRVAQVRVLFTFPPCYPSPFNVAKPLAYVEWFTPFSRPEANSGLYLKSSNWIESRRIAFWFLAAGLARQIAVGRRKQSPTCALPFILTLILTYIHFEVKITTFHQCDGQIGSSHGATTKKETSGGANLLRHDTPRHTKPYSNKSQTRDPEDPPATLRLEQALAQQRLQSYIYPVLTLPPEIVSEIFIHIIPQYPCCPPLTGTLSPTSLTHICRKWRAIALSTPALWRAIQLSLDSLPVEGQVHISDQWLKRSGSCRFSIQLDGYLGRIANVLTSVFRHATRWECLKLEVSPYQLRELEGSNMPLLSHLDLRLHEDSEVAVDAIAFRDLPLLRSVTLNDIAASWVILPWDQLTSLVLNSVYLHECVPILQQTSNLAHCELHIFASDADTIHVIDLPCLQSLVLIHPGRRRDSGRYLESFIVPALRSLQIPEIFLGDDPIHFLTEFVSRSGSKLQEVRVTNLRLESRNMYCEALRSVHRLYFDEDDNPAAREEDSAITSSDQAEES